MNKTQYIALHEATKATEEAIEQFRVLGEVMEESYRQACERDPGLGEAVRLEREAFGEDAPGWLDIAVRRKGGRR